MGSGASMPLQQHVVIVGAGYAGCQLAMSLKKMGAPFTIISARDCMHHNLGSLRAVVEPGFVHKTMIPLATTFGDSFKKGKVIGVLPDTKEVQLDSGETCKYDILVLATGTSGKFPVKYDLTMDKADAVPLYEAKLNKVEQSEKILVVGGGATGTELASEIAVKYPSKKVTLLHRSETLVSKETPQKFQDKLKGILKKQKINLILGETVNLDDIPSDGPTTLTTDKGTEIEADLVFQTIGLPVQTEAYRDAFAHVMEPNGQLKVDEYLRVEGQKDVYAIGDCCNTKDIKLAYTAGEQAILLAENLKAVHSGKREKPWTSDRVKVVLVLALGPNSGLSLLKNGMIMGEFMTSKLKSSDLIYPKYWKLLKQKPPK